MVTKVLWGIAGALIVLDIFGALVWYATATDPSIVFSNITMLIAVMPLAIVGWYVLRIITGVGDDW